MTLISDLERNTVANLGGVQGNEKKRKMRKNPQSETNIFYKYDTPFPGILDPPLHQDVYLENSLISLIQTAALLPYGSPIFRKNKYALSYY